MIILNYQSMFDLYADSKTSINHYMLMYALENLRVILLIQSLSKYLYIQVHCLILQAS